MYALGLRPAGLRSAVGEAEGRVITLFCHGPAAPDSLLYFSIDSARVLPISPLPVARF